MKAKDIICEGEARADGHWHCAICDVCLGPKSKLMPRPVILTLTSANNKDKEDVKTIVCRSCMKTEQLTELDSYEGVEDMSIYLIKR